MTCVRRAWLVLPGGATIDLNNEAGGWFCTSLDLGSPDVREVVNNRPDRDGVFDRTAYMGGRIVSADISALEGAGAQIDAVAAAFGPYMVPAARPVLHYVLDRPGNPERTMTLRAKGYAWPVNDAYERDVQLQWLAADPTAYDPVQHTATAWAGSGGGSGRIYPLTFPRTYPVGSSPARTGSILSAGDLPVRPVFTLWGPAAAPYITLTPPSGPVITFAFKSGANLSAGQSVTIDADAHTVAYDPTHSGLADVNWVTSTWPLLQPGVTYTLRMFGSGTTQVSQATAAWQDGYLS